MRKIQFSENEFYHIYNRGVDKRQVFLAGRDYQRFLETIAHINDENNHLGLAAFKRLPASLSPPRCVATHLGGVNRLVDIICYCLNPNHFHFILKQNKENGISLFMARLSNSYTRYFNVKNKRSGVLFQGRFKSIHINSREYLLYLSAYVNCNNFIHGYNKRMEEWPYGSYLDYVGKRNGKLCQKETILGQFEESIGEYEKFCQINAEYLKEKKELQKYLLEE